MRCRLLSGTKRGIVGSLWFTLLGSVMNEELQKLLAAAAKQKPSNEENERQRRSFAFGNTNIENPRVTKETVDREAEALKHG